MRLLPLVRWLLSYRSTGLFVLKGRVFALRYARLNPHLAVLECLRIAFEGGSGASLAAGRHECRPYSLAVFLRAPTSTIHHVRKTVTRIPNQAQFAEHITQRFVLCDVLSKKTFA